MTYLLLTFDKISDEEINIESIALDYGNNKRNISSFNVSLIDDKSIMDFINLINENHIIIIFEPSVGLYDLWDAHKDEIPDFRYLELKSMFKMMCGRGRDLEKCIKYFGDNRYCEGEREIEMLEHLFALFMSETYLSEENLFGDEFKCCFYDLSDVIPNLKGTFEYDRNLQKERKLFDIDEIEKLVFFDLEAANERDGIAKICEFGAVITDKDFNILDKILFIINPEDDFALGGYGGIELYYSEGFYKRQPPFPEFYERIKNILTDEKSLAIGYAVGNDLTMLATDIWSYELEQLNHDAFDVQDLLMNICENDGNLIGLGKAADLYLTMQERDSIYEHRSLDDALLTMMVYRKILAKHGYSIKESIDLSKNGFLTSNGLIDKISCERRQRKIQFVRGYLK